jgi:hypothetical protein
MIYLFTNWLIKKMQLKLESSYFFNKAGKANSFWRKAMLLFYGVNILIFIGGYFSSVFNK